MDSSGRLFLVGTPIGNLKDITLRALEVLKTVDRIVCEDTRQTKKLLTHYEIRVPVTSFHDHSSLAKRRSVVDALKQGNQIAFVTDNGTPLVSDPGYVLVREALAEKIPVETLPGPTAFVQGLIASGLPCEKFVFEGFLSHKGAARKKRLEALLEEERTLIFYESPHRIVKTLQAMVEVYGARKACLAREMTKKFEEYLRGTLPEVLEAVEKKTKLGEITLVVQGKGKE